MTPSSTSASTRPGRLDGKVALVTGAARGQGRSHALAMATEGADLIITDVAGAVDTVGYPLGTEEQLSEVHRELKELGVRVHSSVVDVRDADAMVEAVAGAVADLGRLDAVVANAGILHAPARSWELTPEQWRTMVDVNLTGVWTTFRAAIPPMIEAGNGGSLVGISSIAGLRGIPGVSHYVAAKHGVVGLIGSLANELAEYGIRANSIHPTNVRTPMIDNPLAAKIFRPDLESPTLDDGIDVLKRINLLDMPWIDASDVTDAVVWLVSDESKRVTGINLPVDAGMLAKYIG
ncbi:mycofactocin-coupled SDR family oxidoreductase [Gordonia rhizosphera]|uniref:Putative oxidoreductase n=1 Tax=Gordonia rhizosphera NBRC 16068 TaxID=1108045 RepID=K6WBL7_9ACTN|nr:mycofactocin-coupled SDR family oxidoreductase [Gordonia rhizosphera]GAB89592.1 putative oxidoreductase [Gordonia rhizosphera NBRC 16068]